MEISDFTPHFGMSRMPFTNQIGTEALLETEPIRAGLNKLGMAVQSNSFAVVTGEPGTGKSTFLRKFSSTLPPDDFMVLYVSMSNITPRWLYSVPLSMLGIKPHMYVNDARRQFHEQIEIQLKSYRKKVVMIIDEAQNPNLRPAALDPC